MVVLISPTRSTKFRIYLRYRQPPTRLTYREGAACVGLRRVNNIVVFQTNHTHQVFKRDIHKVAGRGEITKQKQVPALS